MNHHAPKLKRFWYHDKGDRTRGEVEFVFLGKLCIFTGITFGPAIRKPNEATEEIILTIMKENALVPAEVQFFELMTRAGYGHLTPGTYQYDAIEVFTNAIGISTVRRTVDCPSAVEQIFRHRIHELGQPASA